MSDVKPLNLFFGREPLDDFLEDRSVIKNLADDQIFDVINKTIDWYVQEDFDKEWDKWLKDLSDEEKEIKRRQIRFFLFVFKEFASENVSENALKEDWKNLELKDKHFNYFVKKLKQNKEFSKTALSRIEKPYVDFLYSMSWRIEKRVSRDGSEEKIALAEFLYKKHGEKETVQFSISPKTLDNLIYKLNKIKKELL